MPKVSVIIPIYNKEHRIRKSIESVLNQTYFDFELILINDGSTDNSHLYAMEYAERDSRIVYYNQKNQGVSVARNKGIELSKGEYISFLDADDEIDEKFLEKMIKAIEDKNVCYCGHFYFINGKKFKAKMKFVGGDILVDYLYNICTPNTNSWLIKKKYLNQHQIRFEPDINWGEDMMFFSKVLFYDKNIKFVKDYLSQYHVSSNNCLSENSIDKIDKDIYWMEQVKSYINLHEKNDYRKEKALEAIDSYRIPGGIIYRINSNLSVLEQRELTNLINTYNQFIKDIKLTNGFRSLKLLLFKYKLMFASK